MTKEDPKTRDDDAAWYAAWVKTAPRCEGCGAPFDPQNAKMCQSRDPQRWCCSTCGPRDPNPE